MGKKALVSKVCLVAILIIINVLAVVLSLFLIVAGVTLIALATSNAIRLESLVYLLGFILALGVLFLIISILGLISSISSIPSRYAFRIFSTICITVYMVILLILIIAQVGAVIAGIVLREQLSSDDTVELLYSDLTRLYGTPGVTHIVDGIQSGFGCCGFSNYSSWFANGTNFTMPDLPSSCCNTSISSPDLPISQCVVDLAYPVGCRQSLLEQIAQYLGAVIGVFVVVTVFQICVLVVNLVLMCCIWLDRPAVAYRFRAGSVFAQDSYAPQ